MISTSILAKVDADRLQRGVEGLTKGAYAISITRNTASEISAFVANGDGQTYSVSLTEGRSFCACGDSMFRGKVCKHATALALHVIRTLQATVQIEPERKEEQSQATPNLKLAKVRRDYYTRSASY